jgi:predicted nucleic acid-binding protein
MAFVLDNSVAVAWFLPSQSNDYTRTIAKRLETEKAWVPALWQLEIANVLRTACVRHTLAHTNARDIFSALSKLPIQLDQGNGPSGRQLFELAMRYQLSSYDAAYLELAMRLGLDLATQDQALKHAAMAAQVSLAV